MRAVAILMLLTGTAAADIAPPGDDYAKKAPQIQADVGLAVISLAYEQPLTNYWAVQVEAGITSTYFAPWFDAGQRTDGYEVGLRTSWFPRGGSRGLYVAEYLRGARVTTSGVDGAGYGISAGAFVGWAWRITDRLDLRAGLGAQYMDYRVGDTGINSPFIAIDGVVGYRLY
jgi:hypothetical protein